MPSNCPVRSERRDTQLKPARLYVKRSYEDRARFRSKFRLPEFAMIKLSFPFTEEKIRALKVGDEVQITGTCSPDATRSTNISTTAGNFRPA